MGRCGQDASLVKRSSRVQQKPKGIAASSGKEQGAGAIRLFCDLIILCDIALFGLGGRLSTLSVHTHVSDPHIAAQGAF